MKTKVPFIHSILLIPKVVWGLFLASVGTVFMIHASIGLFPWGTLHAGLATSTGISFGVWSQIIGLIIVCIMAIFKFYPGIGTLLDIFFVGFFIDFIEFSGILPTPENMIMKFIFSILGLFILSYGMSVYLKCGLGAGPRDGLMLMLIHLTGKSVTVVKTTIELTVTILGLALGGPFGFGTILLAVIGGKVLDMVFKWTGYDTGKIKQKNLLEIFRNSEPKAQTETI